METPLELLWKAVETERWIHAWMLRKYIEEDGVPEDIFDAFELADRRLVREAQRVGKAWPNGAVDVQVAIGIIVASAILAAVIVLLRWFPDAARAALLIVLGR